MEESNGLVLINRKWNNKLKKANMRIFKNILKFIIFDIFVLLVFFVTSYKIFALIFLFSILTAKKCNIKIAHMIQYFYFLVPLILITFCINIYLIDIKYAILIMIRFIIACMITYIFSKTISTLEISKVIETVLMPLKLLKVDVKNIGLLVSIAISFIPILKDELFELKQILESKGYIMKPNNIYMYVRPLIISIFKRTNEIEKAVIAKGYVEN